MSGKSSGNNMDVPSINDKLFVLPNNFTVADASTDNLHTQDAYYRAELKHRFNNNWHLYAQTAYINGHWGGYLLDADDDVAVSNDTLYRASNFDNYRNHSFVMQAYLNGKFFTGKKIEHKISAGIDYCAAYYKDISGGTWDQQKFGLNLNDPDYHINQDSLKGFEIDDTSKVNWGWTSFYLQDHIKIANKLVITLAGHYTYAPLHFIDPNVPKYQQNTHSDKITPRLGLTWLFSENISIYALYDNCFWQQQGKNFYHLPFDPLTGYNLESGIKSYFFQRRLISSLSVFNLVKNHVVTIDPLHPGDEIERGQITSKGVDFDLTGNITQALMINANYSYNDAKISKDSDPNMIGLKNPGAPDQLGNCWIKYKLLHGKLKNVSLAIGFQHMGKRNGEVAWIPGTTVHYLPCYNLLDAALSYSTEKFHISLNAYNLSNTNYAVFGSFYSAINEWRYTPGEHINFRLS